MKIIKWSELKEKTTEAPFYCVMKDNPAGFADGRAFGCSTLAFLKLSLLLRKRFKIEDGKTAYDLAKSIISSVPENDNKMSFKAAMDFIDRTPLFNSCRMLLLNPNGMNPEVFLRIAMERLLKGEVVLAMLEVPDNPGAEAKNELNHFSVFHGEKGDVYMDGLKLDLDTFINICHYSKLNTLTFFQLNVEEEQ